MEEAESEFERAQHEWLLKRDEINELKKIFFEFVSKWMDESQNVIKPNEPTYFRQYETEPFLL